MASEDLKKHWTAHAPGILTGAAALIAALTGVYVNMRGDKSSVQPVAVQAVPVTTPVPVASAPKVAVPVSQTLDLKLDRVRVDNDGSMGTTDWTFDVSEANRSLFSVPFKALSDDAGENLVKPAEPDIAHARLTLASEQSSEVVVRGWKQGWTSKTAAPDVIGKAQLKSDGVGLVIEAKSEKANGPAFVLYFSAEAKQK
jgi:hypothetical protein